MRPILRAWAIAVAMLAWGMSPPAGHAQDAPRIQIVLNVPHSQPVTSLALSGDGTRAISASRDKSLKLWDVATWQLLRNFDGHKDGVTSVAFSADGTRIASGSRDQTIKLWDATTGELVRTLDAHAGDVASVVFSVNGAQLVSGGADKAIKLWETDTGKLLRTLEGHAEPVTAVAISADAKLVLSGSADKSVKLWDAASGQELRTFKGHAGAVTSVAFAPDAKRVLSGSADKTLKTWDAASGRLLATSQGHTAEVNAVAFAPDGKRAVSAGADRTLKLWDPATGKLLGTFPAQSREANAVAFAPDGTWVLSGGRDNTLSLWDATSRVLLGTFGGGSGVVTSVAFSPDGTRVVSGGRDKTIQVWDAAKGELVIGFEGHPDEINSVAFSPDSKQVLSGSRDKTLRLWDAAKGEPVRTFEGHADAVHSVAFSPDGRWAVSGSEDKSLKQWDVATGKAVKTLQGHTGAVREVAVSGDGKRIVSGSSDKSIKLWDAESGALVRTITGHAEQVTSVAFSPDGTRIASTSRDKTLRLWDAASGELLRTFRPLAAGATSVAFSPDGARLVTGTWDNELVLWDAAAEEPIGSYKAHSGPVFAVAFSPDGKRLASGSADTAVRIWDAAKPSNLSLAGLFRNRAGEWLSMIRGGFFNASARGADMLGVVRGFDTFSMLQFYDHLYRPDLVAESLKGDPARLLEDAVSKLNLRALMESGPVPQVEYIADRTLTAGAVVRLAMRVVDTGGGIGTRVVWRVNGKAQGTLEPEALKGRDRPSPGNAVTLVETLKVDPGRINTVEFTAYNGSARMATTPFPVMVNRFGATTRQLPRMHLLAIGVDKYRSPDYQLTYAAKDAQAFSKAMTQAAKSLYSEVSAKALIDAQVTEASITAELDRIGAAAKATDVFVLFLAGHGKSVDGRYHYFPQDIDFKAAGPELLAQAISQDKWQSTMLAKVGHVQKSLLILDTCESGEAVLLVGADGGRMASLESGGGATLVRYTERARQTAIEQLQYATGHNFIAASRQAAFEGYMGHGVLTYALLEALQKRRGDRGDGRVGVTLLAGHVEERVPEITRAAFGIEQRPTRRLTGSDFPLGVRVLDRVEPIILRTPTHTLIRGDIVREQPREDAAPLRQLSAGTTVRVLERAGAWVMVAREGQRIGYVRQDALAPLQ